MTEIKCAVTVSQGNRNERMLYLKLRNTWSTGPEFSVSPFDLEDDSSYQRWRNAKLDNYPTNVEQVMIEVKDINHLSVPEQQELIKLCRKANLSLYHSRTPLTSKNKLKTV